MDVVSTVAERDATVDPAGRVPAYHCPIDRTKLEVAGEALGCPACGTAFPVVDGVPVLINDANSVFRISDYAGHQGYGGASAYVGAAAHTSGLRSAYRRFATALSEASLGQLGFEPADLILAEAPDAHILVIGSGERDRKGTVVLTDVAFARNVDCICDGHDLPFADASFDAVMAEAVLEHVCDPVRVVAEITRVLRPGGLVFAITPFLQPVHMGAYDFTRFTYLGHRRLFRDYDDIRSGMAAGPLGAHILIGRALLTSLTDRPKARAILRLIGLLLTWPIRFLDPVFRRTEGAYNAASATYFFGRKRETPISDRDILALFRGK